MRKLLGIGLVASLMLAGCTVQPGAVQGFQSGGGAKVISSYRAASADSLGMPAGTASYMGASDDGSVLGFIGADGIVRWYRVR